MIAGFYMQIAENRANNDLGHKLSLLPQFLQHKIAAKRQQLDVHLSITGNLLLLKLIDHFKLDLKLDDLGYGPYQRPYFDAGFDFNISHSGNCVICCGTMEGKIGVDIEVIKPIDINYDDYFTNTEQQNIRAAQNQQTEFFKYWTRKEAVLKAVGTGVYTPLLAINVSSDEVIYKGEHYYLSPLEVGPGFAGHIASTLRQDIYIKKAEV
ncbi:4'-phosphopantetheinyl transferase family protein [Mucilaginibacter ximonensis]|uniref:4'-phosphopantetheinyl transferase family protein n=1 Tax=Mucilaginibacter ximonensis TaxID=538021 RepID=A0ABW5Y6X3_9SPHI